MSDLSRVLGDLYGASDPDGPPVVAELSAEERAKQAEPSAAAADSDLKSVLDEALASIPTEPRAVLDADDWADHLQDEPSHLHQRGALRAWTRSDDDFLPSKGRKWNHRNKHH